MEIIENEENFSRYLFFYINYLINNNQIESYNFSGKIELIGSNLIIAQTKFWIKTQNLYKIKNLFSCQKETDILSEFFYIISNFFSVKSRI